MQLSVRLIVFEDIEHRFSAETFTALKHHHNYPSVKRAKAVF